jgi:hypothetical protein
MSDITAPGLDGNLTFGLGGGPAPAAEPEPFEVDLRTYLEGSLGVRAWPGALPAGYKQSDLPALVYSLAAHESEPDLDGPGQVQEWSIRFDAYGRSMLDAARLIARLGAGLDGFRGAMGNTVVQQIIRTGGAHNFEELPNGSALPTQRRSAEFWIAFEGPP